MLSFLLGMDYGMGLRSAEAGKRIGGEVDLRSKDVELEARLNSLELACAGLWKLLKEKGFSEQELARAIEEIDALDGRVDGKIKPQAGACPACNRKALSRQADRCLWCGAAMPAKGFGV